VIVQCAHCAQPFQALQRRTPFCSIACSAASRRKPRPLCEHCGAAPVNELGKRFCSPACASAAASLPVAERFWARVEKHDVDCPCCGGCWIWRGGTNGGVYGKFQAGSRRRGAAPVFAHRFAYELLVAPIADGLTLDHLCRNTFCVNPAHLEPVTLGENLRRAARAAR
jgi:hypothetical protein